MKRTKRNPTACAAHASSGKTQAAFAMALSAYGLPDDYVNHLLWCRDNHKPSVSLDEFNKLKETLLAHENP